MVITTLPTFSEEVANHVENHKDALPQNLDVMGCAEAFAALHGWNRGVFFGVWRTFPALAFDPSTQTWRTWSAATGWEVQRSVLSEMHAVVVGMCALQAMHEGNESGGIAKAEKEYRKLREKHLAMTVDKAIRLVQVWLTVEEWDRNEELIGLPRRGSARNLGR